MPDRLMVQRDDVGRVVRVVTEDDEGYELDPDTAEELGESLIRSARELRTEQAELPAEPSDEQHTLDDQSDSPRKPLTAMLEEDRDPPDIGGVINDSDPLQW